MRYPSNIREEELKNRVAADFFHKYDSTGIIKDIDFAVKANPPQQTRRQTCPSAGGEFLEAQYLLWAEAKKNATDIIAMLSQLVLTIGKARTFNEVLPPKFLGCFDCEKIAFIPYADIQDVFHQNDFNWNVAPSNRNSREFKQIYKQIDKIINNGDEHKTYRFNFEKDEKSLKLFILKNFMPGLGISKIRIDKNNFISIYSKWLEAVKPTIAVNWAAAKKIGIIDGDFYLADLLSANNVTIKEKLFVLLKSSIYKYNRQTDALGEIFREAYFSDKQKAHAQFWAIYERPPREAYWDYIIERRDLLVPQDIRERKGSFFTPKIWVELSQKYIADALGENWQEEYYVWDCAAGTGNLLAGLTNKYNIWASTLDKADVDVMHDRIENGANLLKEHCFQFDFLNDEFSKLPEGLREIIDDPKKRKKLVVYINPPYVEAMNKRDTKNAKTDVNRSKIEKKYLGSIGKSVREVFIQFLIRSCNEIQNCKIANFSTLKAQCAPNFADFRKNFRAKLERLFVCPADTFDNVNGQFPIGFHIWDTGKKEIFKQITADVFDKNGNLFRTKEISNYDNVKTMNAWLKQFAREDVIEIAAMCCVGNDFQHNNFVNINHKGQLKGVGNAKGIAKFEINQYNLIPACIYFAVRHCIESTWLNDRDQFLYPNDGWEDDDEFQNDCLAYTLFHGQNNISSKHGINHWIPFIEWDVEPKDRFKSHFMTDFFAGPKYFIVAEPTIFYNASPGSGDGGSGARKKSHNEKTELKFSKTARNVFKAGLKLWKYYHAQTHPCPSEGGIV
ncbi:hypothetical protein R83H12_00306 [Fibrobacteria bacterium R8-3-H12]